MGITDLDVFMGNLKRLIYDNSNMLIVGNQLIQKKMPEIQLLYEEFGYVIESGFKKMNTDEEQLHEVEDVENWERRLRDVAQEAENIVDMFVSSAVLTEVEEEENCKRRLLHEARRLLHKGRRLLHKAHKRRKLSPDSNSFYRDVRNNDLDCSLNLKDVMEELECIRKEMGQKIRKFQGESSVNKNNIDHLIESPSASAQVAETSSTKTTTRVNPSATEHEQFIVGFDEDAVTIMDRLTGDRKQLEVISIVGMGGLGKTTLATKIYNDPYVAYHFDVRGWITVSEAYATRDLLTGILASIGKSVHEATTEQKLCEMVYRSLKGRKYLIVIDDIWSAKAWDNLRLCFPNDNTGSRVLLTTRLKDVAWHASPGGFSHNLQYLTEERSWELLRRKTFRGYDCPESLVGTGKSIAKKCQGLPLALVVIAGILEKGEKRIDLWEKIAESVSSYIVQDPKGCLDTLALSYDHLPRHLRNCFLYVGGFPDGYKIQARRLIRLWMAEGFIKEAPQRSLEEQAEDYLIDLVDRNLLIVVDRRYNGEIKSCRLHDLLRELCLIKAAERKFFKKMGTSDRYFRSDSTSSVEKQHRLFTDYKVLCEIYSHESATQMRSVLCFSNSEQLDKITRRWVPSFLLLRVLDLLNIQISDFVDIRMLIHLRYLAVWTIEKKSSFSVANPRILETLILKGNFDLQDAMTEMVNLRHLWSESIISIRFPLPVLCNLQTMSKLRLDASVQFFLLASFPNIKKLACLVTEDTIERFVFASLPHLEALDVECVDVDVDVDVPGFEVLCCYNLIRFPQTLKKLTLQGLRLHWSCMSTIQQLPNLEVLKLLNSSFLGSLWDTGDEQFCKLKFLKLKYLNIQRWVASTINFPQLRKLEVRTCKNLEGIPVEIGHISTLQHIEIDDSNYSVRTSVDRIQKEQRAVGNYDIQVKLLDIDPREVFFQGNPYYF